MDSVGTPIVGGESFSTKPRGIQGKIITAIVKEKHLHCYSGLTPGCVCKEPKFPIQARHTTYLSLQFNLPPLHQL